MKEGLTGKNITPGMPSVSAASNAKLVMKQSATMQETLGSSDASLSLAMRLTKGSNQLLEMEVRSFRRLSREVLISEGGRPSGMLLNRKSGSPSSEVDPTAFSNR
ncbi:hypothetical protein FRX31_021743 [Thalictrum thalictroides]|uniref:Uncharacterized protein n=1 Tax=Thalictrum thalictroides TaxID=46969 RepID=A0A7J6VU98_THATH|nr:hypothetical protein FRX31_021743 [Thalictrum thalictroides]